MPVTDVLGRLTALDPDGTPVPLGSLWAHQPILLVWVRHFG